MRIMMQRLWHDDQGALIAAEYLFVATILVIGTVVGLAGLREAINTELTELGNAILAISQGFSVSGSSGDSGSFDGFGTFDTPGMLTDPIQTPPAFPSFIDAYPGN
jgi:Flp pilus assembly pilin Flp